jgi:two-component sensor histidine kinase
MSGFAVHPRSAPPQSYAVPVLYLDPADDNKLSVFGYDISSEPVRRAAMDEAERTHRPTASGKLRLLQDGPTRGQPGFIIFMPVFESDGAGSKLKGFLYSVFSARGFLQAAVEAAPPRGLGVALYDGPVSPDRLLARTEGAGGNGGMAFERVAIGTEPWTLMVRQPADWTLSILSIATIVFGLLLASLLMLLVRVLTRQAMEDEATLRWFEEQASIRNSLTRELNHRVKNTLANVLSIIALTRRRASNLDEFADGLDGRIRALSATHDLLTQSDWGTTPIRAVIEAELTPYAQDGDHEVELQGPDIQLAPNDALSLGLATHELATNAAKYGALSKPGGKIAVHWHLIAEKLVRVEWQESGGPPVMQQRGRGFGTDLIERIVAHELKNPVELSFNPDGVRCVLTIAVRQPSAFSIRANRSAPLEPRGEVKSEAKATQR